MPVPALPQPLPVSVVDQANNSARSFVASASGAANGEAASEGARTDSLHVSATHGASISGTVLPPSSTMVATREEREADDAEREERDNLLAKDKRGRRLNGVDADTMDVLADKPTNSFKRSAARALLFSTTDDGETDDGGVAKGAGGSAAAAAAANGAGSTAEEDEERVCRICREGDEEEPLVAPCCCTGSVRWVHRSCLDHWRVESAKRNIGNVNNCEICKKPFTIGIRRSTLFWQSSKHVVNGVLLFITCFITIFCITTFTHSVIGELSCVATYHKVAYTSMFEFQGLALSLFAYCLIVLMILFSNLVVYSWFRSRPDVEEYVNAMHIIPSFWTRRNVARIVGVSVVLVAQVLSMGYLIKIFMYTTSNIAWTWEISPLLGGIIFTVFMTFCLGFAVQLRERWQQHVNQRATDVVVDSGAAATTTAPAAPGAAGGAAPQGQPAAGDDVVNATGVSGEAANPPHDATSAPFPAEGDRNAAHHRSPVPSQQGVRTVAGAVDVDGSPRSVDHDISVDAAMSPASAVTAQLALTSSSAAGRQGGPEEQGGGRVTSAATAGRDPFATPPEMRVIRAYEYCPPRRAPPPQ